MANYDGHNWGGGFPFSASPFKSRTFSVSARIPFVDLPNARINDAHILEGRTQGSILPRIDAPETAEPILQAIESLPTTPPFAQRPIARQVGLRLLPLESFIWGSRNVQTLPRIRPDHTLLWLTKGFAQLSFPRRRETLAYGAVRFIPADMAFSFSPRPEISGHVLLIAPALTQNTDPAFPHSYIAGNIGDAGDALLITLRELEAEGAKRDPGKALHTLLGMLRLQLTRLSPPIMPTAFPAYNVTARRPLVEQFLELAANRMQTGETIADLAQELGVSAAVLDHACLSAKGKRAIDLMHRLRFDRAVDMLRAGRHSPAQIARLLGYTSHTHFTRAFVEATGKKPEYFRESGRNKRGC